MLVQVAGHELRYMQWRMEKHANSYSHNYKRVSLMDRYQRRRLRDQASSSERLDYSRLVFVHAIL